tara:strand:- start:1874 stop:6328 length:4455 start_codon:yes stop_codon:yes gene_type:complete
MSIETLQRTDTVSFDTARITEALQASRYKVPWYQKSATTIGRIPVRLFDDTVNTISEFSGGRTRINTERNIYGEAEAGFEEVGAEVGSIILGFFTAGGAVAKGVQTVGKGIQATKRGDKFFKSLSRNVNRIERNNVGKSAGWATRLMTDGALRGGVADFIAADVEDEATILESLNKRSEEVLTGMLWGAGLNLGFGSIGKAYKEMVTFSGKQAKVVKKALKETDEIKEALEEGKTIDEIIEEKGDGAASTILANITEISKDFDEVTGIKAEDLSQAGMSDFKPAKEDSFFGDVDPENIKEADVDEIEDNLLKKLATMKDLPSQMQASKIFLLETEVKLFPEIDRIYAKIAKLFTKPDVNNFNEIRTEVEKIKGLLKAYRLAVQIDAKAGTVAAKTLAARNVGAFGQATELTKEEALKKFKAFDFNKTVEYRDEVKEVFDRVDVLLQTVESISKTDPEDLFSFVRHKRPKEFNLVKALKKLEKRGKKSRSDVLTAMVMNLGKTNTDTLWSKYTKSIKDFLKKNKKKKKKPSEKALLNVFSKSIRDKLNKKIEGAKPEAKTKLQKLEKQLSEVNDLVGNKDKVNALLKELGAEELTSVKNVDELIEGDIDKLAEDLLKYGDELDFEELGIDGDLASKILNSAEELKLRNQFDLEQEELFKAAAKEKQLKELEKLLDTGDEDQIQKFFEDIDAKATKQEKDEVDQLIAKRKSQLKKMSNPTLEDVSVLLMNDLEGLVARMEIEPPSRWENFNRGFEKFRMSMMLFHPKTWLIGPVSGTFHLIADPIINAVRAYNKIKIGKKEGRYENVEALKYAWTEIRSAFFGRDIWESLRMFGAAWKKGRSAFNPRINDRFYQEFMDVSDTLTPQKLAGMNPAQKKKFKELIEVYGTDNETTKTELQKFLRTLQESDNAQGLAKVFDFFTSISFRNMGAFDDIFRTAGTMRALRAEAMQKALIAGKTTEADLNKYMEEYIKKATSKDSQGLLQWNMLEEFKNVEQAGLATTYQADYSDKAFSQMMKKLADWSRDYKNDDPVRLVIRQFIIPFVKTPTAIGQWIIDKSIGMGVYRRWNAGVTFKKEKDIINTKINDLKASERNAVDINLEIQELEKAKETLTTATIQAKADAMADIYTGITLATTFVGMAYSGNITGSGNHMTSEEKEMAKQAGWKPFMLKLPFTNLQISYERIEPISAFLSIAADMVAHYDRKNEFKRKGYTDEDGHNLTMTLIAGLAEIARNKYFLRSVSDLLSIAQFNEPERRQGLAQNMTNSYIASLTPRIIKDIREITDPYQKEARSTLGKLEDRVIGGTNEGYKRNIFGEKVERQRSREGFGLLSPVYFYGKKVNDPLLRDMSRMQANFGQKSRHVQSLQGQRVNTRDYLDDKGRSLHDAWLEHMGKFSIRNKRIRQAVRDEYRKLKDQARLPINAPEGQDSIANRLNTLINDYEKESFRDFVNTKGRRFKHVDDGQSVANLQPEKPLLKLLDINPRTSF